MDEEIITWLDCIKLHDDLQNMVPGVIDRIKAVKKVDFGGIVIGWEASNWTEQVNKVARSLRMIGDLKSVCLINCNPSESQIYTLYEIFENVKFTELVLQNNPKISVEGWRLIGMLVNRSSATYINVQSCGLNTYRLVKLIQGSDDAKIIKLDISGNETIETEGWIHLGKFIDKCGLKELRARGCHPTRECVNRFVQWLGDSKLDVLELSDDQKVNIDAVVTVLPHVYKQLILRSQKFDNDSLIKLRDKLQSDNLTLLTIEVDDSIGESLYLTDSWEPPLPPPPPDINISPVEVNLIESLKKSLMITKEKIIGSNGGHMNVNGCGVNFIAGVVEPGTKVSVSVNATSCDLPTGYVDASPELEIRSTQPRLNGSAEITLPVHNIAEDNKYDIVHKESRNDKWRTYDSAKQQGNKLKFLSGVLGFFKAILPRKKKFKLFLRHFLYYKSELSDLYAVICVANKTVINACESNAIKFGFKPALVQPDELTLHGDDELTYNISCINESTSLNPPCDVVLTENNFNGVNYYQKQFALILSQSLIPPLSIKYKLSSTMMQNKESVISLPWKKRVSTFDIKREMTNSVQKVKVKKLEDKDYRDQLDANDVYLMNGKSCKGKVLIINNEFKGKREGSKIDVRNMEDLWKGLGLQVSTKLNVTAEEMRLACSSFARGANAVGVTVLIIMTHGGKRDGQEFFCGEDNNVVSSEEVISYFTSTNSPHLEAVPKVFMFQACRGNEMETGMEGSDLDTDAINENVNSNRRDMLIAYPSRSGFVAFRHRETGSWMINAVTNVFMMHAHDTHVLDMMTKVNEAVSRREGRERGVQTCNQFSSLTKKLFLFPGWPGH